MMLGIKKIASILSLILISGFLSYRADAYTSYDISITLNADQSMIDGVAKIKFRNDSNKALQTIQLLLYPNQHSEKSPYLNDVNYKWIYPDDFEPSTMEVDSILYMGKRVKFREIGEPPLHRKSLIEILPESPLKPGGEADIEMPYTVRIPKKFGPFGRYRGEVILNGGFYPYLCALSKEGDWLQDAYPDRSDFLVTARGKKEFFLNGAKMSMQDGVWRASLKGRDYLSLANSKEPLRIDGPQGRLKVAVYFRKNSGVRERLLDEVDRFIEFTKQREELKDIAGEIFLREAYLRDRLILPSDGGAYFSDRLYKVFKGLRDYHSIEVIRGLFYELLRERVRERESAKDYDWVLNTLAWHYTEQYLKWLYAGLKRDARDIRIVRAFSFLPQMDQVIYAPQFSSSGVFYNQIYSSDAFRLDVLDFNNRIRSKRVVYEKLKEIYGREKDMAAFYAGYLRDTQSFVGKAAEVLGGDSSAVFARWLGSYPGVNYVLKSIKREKKKGGGYVNTIGIGKEGDASVLEPVEIYLEEWGGKDHTIYWDGREDSTEIEIETEERLRTVHIDPAGRKLETKLADNRSPELYKWILTEFSLGLDVNAIAQTISVLTTFRKLYGSHNRYILGGYKDISSYGAILGYVRLFGRLLDRLRMSHGFGLYYNFDGLSTDFIVMPSGIDDPSSDLRVMLNPEGLSTSLTAYYFFGNQLSYTNPKEGFSSTIYAGVGSKYLGGDFNFYKAGFNCNGVIPFNQSNLLAARLTVGVSGEGGIPPQLQFSLGGIDAMKGFPDGEIDKVGRHRLILSGEYRHYLIKDRDISLASIFRTRDLMGVFFMDFGRVSATVAEYADKIANGADFNSNPLALFNLKKYDVDIGYGIRIFYDTLGVRETVLAINVAKSLTEFNDYGIRFYVSFDHSF